ncbi:MAG: hypothetical protein LBE83_01535, partial [Propionibacteriaceae bacterium]|nr:hypothetical protein [Propionibacteriaceae bacterium]
MWRTTLAENGITVDAVDHSHVRVSAPCGSDVMWLKELSERVSASQLRRPAESPAMLAVPTA